MIKIDNNIELDETDLRKLESFVRRLENEKKQRIAKETVPKEQRVYVMDIRIDSIMTSRADSLAQKIKGKKEAEYIARQLSQRHGRKFYIEEC